MTPDELLIIGYGNPLRGDNGAGWYVAERLAGEIDDPAVRIVMQHQLMPEFAEAVSQVGRLLLIDAAEGARPGAVAEIPVTPAETTGRPMTHHMTPENLLAWARDLYGRFPETTLFTITGGDFSHTEDLSPAVRAACDTLVDRLITLAHHHA